MSVVDMTVVITGASSGVGAEAARQLHDAGARVIAVGRDPRKTKALTDELGIEGATVDFTALADVRRLADHLRRRLTRIDVLAANAGGIPRDTLRTPAGIEATFQVNALAPWLLTTLLAPLLGGGRVIATSSRSHTAATLTTDELDAVAAGLSRPLAHHVYARAKLAGAILLREFGHRHPEITVADFHPGVIASDFGRYMGTTGAVLKTVARPFLDSPADGARRLAFLASADAADINGRYFVRNRPAAGSPHLDDRELATRLWQLAERLTRP
ncbi:Short-chain dehydrogenase [Streptomyces sp. 2323.1]|uniref:SDR family NAD(P)-dependent oxidoreductase n=1 Tax=Streptomyces sp. 2323.1 TaxID=1938841 RepID=UPI000BBF4960|nr:SDR family NAD(P)-dependent oxidoreductase [Streptomyces sp. 2323.1]SOE15891.1 Short-chain dehydrogenase [Streptomyces sp. 2323.1]